MNEANNTTQDINRWMMYRAKLFNFWYYPNQEFNFTNGCGILRGHNGSGKSVTTQSLVTVLLDGDTRSHKLDPFGGRERTIRETVLGEEELLGLQERIGYLVLEFKKEQGEIYKTLGMGIQVKRDKRTPKVWHFILDGKRIGEEEGQLRLFKEEKIEGTMQAIPLNEEEFKTMIAKHRCGRIYSKRDEYAEQVNKHLFGFDTVTGYKELIDLLIQARSPKLSDQSRPDGVADVLSDSLPQLTNAELSPLTTSIESIDRLEKQLVAIKKDKKAIEKVSNAYDKYNRAVLAEKANEFLKSLKDYERLTNEVESLNRSVEKQRKRMAKIQTEKHELQNNLEAYKVKLDNLGVDDIQEIEGKKQETLQKLSEWKMKLQKEERKREKTESRFREVREKKDQLDMNVRSASDELVSYLRELQDIADETGFEGHNRYYTHFKGAQNETEYSFHGWLTEIQKYQSFLSMIKGKLQEKEMLDSRLTDVINSLGNLQMEIDQAQKRMFLLEENIEKEVQLLTARIQTWATNAVELALEEDVVHSLIGYADEVYDTLSYPTYVTPLDEWYTKQKNGKEMSRLETELALRQLKTRVQETVESLETWKNKVEIDPPFVEEKQQQWSMLREKGIDFVTFYEAYEFVEDISSADKIAIQQALAESGVLSAVLVEPIDKTEAQKITTVLEQLPKKKDNLTAVLKPSQHSHLASYLEGISFKESEEGYILATGQFKSTFVSGQATPTEETVYIGKEAREQYRMDMVAQLEEEYTQALSEQANLEQVLTTQKGQLETLKQEYASFPSFKELKSLYSKKTEEEKLIQNVYETQRTQLDKKADGIRESIKQVTSDVKRNMDFSELPLTVDAFTKEESTMNNYQSCLRTIQDAFGKRNNSRSRMVDLKIQFDDLEQGIEESSEDIAEYKLQIDKTNKMIAVYDEQLKEMGSDDIRKTVKELTREINHVIPKSISQLEQEHVRLQFESDTQSKQVDEKMSTDVPYRQEMKSSWENAFHEHYKLGYLVVEADSNDLRAIATKIVEQYGYALDKKRETILKLKNELGRVYQSQNIELFSYDLQLETVSSEFAPTFETEQDEKQTALTFATEKMKREKVTLDYEGTRVSPALAVQKIDERIEDLEMNASEKDRDLYERILVNTLGDNIRRKIHYVQHWEKEMNKFMEHENLIKFRIKWVPKKKEKEEELDTVRLVELLKKDSQWIDLDEISKHFRSKIKQAKRMHESQQEGINLQQIMREVLDYRKWFNFEIYFTKKGAKELRLTKNTFGTLSGGQRVLALITPILAAVYAKYSEADPECPKLITLDEAFARVDEINIRAMFEYIRKMGFNYILNSQSLWGCFDSVPSLNIYELARPDNIPAVAVESYYWNGHEKQRIVTPTREEEHHESRTGKTLVEIS